MPSKAVRTGLVLLAGCTLAVAGCSMAPYKSVVRPVPKLSVLSPELEHLTDAAIETYLKADVRPVFPTTLAVARLQSAPRPPRARGHDPVTDPAEFQLPRGEEAAGWRSLAGPWPSGPQSIVEQVQLVGPLLVRGEPTLKNLRDAAALLHAPLLVVYLQADDSQAGYNDAAMAYWTIVGLFCVPGNTVGHYATCQALILDTRSGFVLATAEGEAKFEENVLPGAVDIATQRVQRQAQARAIADLQTHVQEALLNLAQARGVSASSSRK